MSNIVNMGKPRKPQVKIISVPPGPSENYDEVAALMADNFQLTDIITIYGVANLHETSTVFILQK